MLIGYARVSTKTQDTETQINALKMAGCEKIFHEKESGGRWERPQLQLMMSQLRKGDVVVVWKLDRFSRSLSDLLLLMEKIDRTECGFKSLTEAIDTTTSAGRMMMQIIGSFSEFEKSILRERTLAGLEAARRRGIYGGRPNKLNKNQEQEIVRLVTSGVQTAADAARLFNLDRSTISRMLKRHRALESV